MISAKKFDLLILTFYSNNVAYAARPSGSSCGLTMRYEQYVTPLWFNGILGTLPSA